MFVLCEDQQISGFYSYIEGCEDKGVYTFSLKLLEMFLEALTFPMIQEFERSILTKIFTQFLYTRIKPFQETAVTV
jgi:hypothetical protein